ncbi:hypothetical protein [Dapis sp. BLCC M126]|uniref:hypothetical protein n=1 Tax=Dapis sp. BLCC M126 TaxID=3400189 RepID=UPI003CEDB882
MSNLPQFADFIQDKRRSPWSMRKDNRLLVIQIKTQTQLKCKSCKNLEIAG